MFGVFYFNNQSWVMWDKFHLLSDAELIAKMHFIIYKMPIKIEIIY